MPAATFTLPPLQPVVNQEVIKYVNQLAMKLAKEKSMVERLEAFLVSRDYVRRF
jgi:hypothetical protein